MPELKVKPEIFDIELADLQVRVERIDIDKQVIFKVNWPDGKTLCIARAKSYTNELFWTSIPEGNPDLAEQIGLLIEQHYRALI